VKVVLFCGGKGSRWAGVSPDLPKPLALVGDRPILWHVMAVYSACGFNDFILCLGHMQDRVTSWVESMSSGREPGPENVFLLPHGAGVVWRVTLRDTGVEAATGARLRAVGPLVAGSPFMASYADSIADIDLNDLLAFHASHGKLATLTAVRPRSQFGVLKISDEGLVSSFVEKPPTSEWVNGGYFVLEPEVLDLVGEDALEESLLPRLASRSELAAYQSQAFWACVDTQKDQLELDGLWRGGNAPWLGREGFRSLRKTAGETSAS
jgi:glucose-1-phosphate cytidylyltransferase